MIKKYSWAVMARNKKKKEKSSFLLGIVYQPSSWIEEISLL